MSSKVHPFVDPPIGLLFVEEQKQSDKLLGWEELRDDWSLKSFTYRELVIAIGWMIFSLAVGISLAVVLVVAPIQSNNTQPGEPRRLHPLIFLSSVHQHFLCAPRNQRTDHHLFDGTVVLTLQRTFSPKSILGDRQLVYRPHRPSILSHHRKIATSLCLCHAILHAEWHLSQPIRAKSERSKDTVEALGIQ